MMNIQVYIIGISGFKQVGKDTAADQLISDSGFIRLAFADKLKELAESGSEAIRAYMPWVSSAELDYFSDVLPWNGSKTGKSREMLQWLGTDVGRKHNPDIWVNALTENIERLVTTSDNLYTSYPDKYKSNIRIVIPDCRFPNEFGRIKNIRVYTGMDRHECYSEVWRVKRPSIEQESLKDLHPSEAEQLAMPDSMFDAILINDTSVEAHQAWTALELSEFFQRADRTHADLQRT